jgi:hypothetical protein
MCFVFIVEISNLLKRGDGLWRTDGFRSGQVCAQDGPGMRRIGPGSRSRVWMDAEVVRGLGGAGIASKREIGVSR